MGEGCICGLRALMCGILDVGALMCGILGVRALMCGIVCQDMDWWYSGGGGSEWLWVTHLV